MAIQNLSSVTSITGSDAIALFSASIGADAKTTLSILLAWMQEQMGAAGGLVTQYSAPSATGFSVTVTPPVSGGSVWLLLTPAAGYAAGTIVMPAAPVDGQEVVVSCTQAITTLTVSGNGSTLNGAPSTLAANGFFRMRYDGVFKAFYRVG